MSISVVHLVHCIQLPCNLSKLQCIQVIDIQGIAVVIRRSNGVEYLLLPTEEEQVVAGGVMEKVVTSNVNWWQSYGLWWW